MNVVESIYESWENSMDGLGIFCDLSKAFDCVNHDILLQKLHHYGVREDALGLMKCYLVNGEQSVDVKGVLSNARGVTIGVPQGSILGPFLFLVYINDLPYLVEKSADIILFADDTSLMFKVNRNVKDIDVVNNTLNLIQNWFSVNNLMLNPDKTKCVKFSLTNNCAFPAIHIDSKVLNLTKKTKFLGLTLDSKLQWGPHIADLSGKLSSAAYAVRKIRECTDVKTARIVYYSYFHSLMSYGLLLWGNAADANSIFLLQKRAVRAIYYLKARESLREKFKTINILTMPSLYIYMNIMYARKNLHKFKLSSEVHSHDTRHKHKIVVARTRLSKINKSFVSNCVRFYNILPDHIVNLQENAFKNTIKRILMEKAYYKTDEFLADIRSWQDN